MFGHSLLMSKSFCAAAFAVAASAAALRRADNMEGCTFQITASGGVNGVMGQFEDGQNRINGSYPAAYYTYQNGGIVDADGRGCIVTLDNDVTHQFQCDLNKEPSYGFTIAQNGTILYKGNAQFYACPYINEYNVYTEWLQDQDECKPINLSTNATCAAGAQETGPHGPGYTAGYTGKPISSTAQQSVPEYDKPTGSVPSYGGKTSGVSTTVAYGETYPVQSTAPSSPSYDGYASDDSDDSDDNYDSIVSVPGYGGDTFVPIDSTTAQTGQETTTQTIPG